MLLQPLLLALAYALGAVPFGVLIAKAFKGIDPRTQGSGNPGATNVARLCGLPFGILTLACDLLKGLLPVWLAMQISDNALFHSLTALAAVSGHIKSFFLNFHGGKGVATTIGALIPLGFWPLLTSVVCCVAIIGLTGYVSTGSLMLVASLIVIYPLFGRWELLPLALVLLCIVFWTHRENIQRLALGTEKGFLTKRG